MTAARRPDSEALRFAAEWLRQYDDSHDGGQQSAVAVNVADWLDAQADASDVRDAAREHGVTVGMLRTAMQRANQRRATPEATTGVRS